MVETKPYGTNQEAHLAISGSQSELRIHPLFPDYGASHIINLVMMHCHAIASGLIGS